MHPKPLYMQSDDEILDNAAKVLKSIRVCSILYDIAKIKKELSQLAKSDVVNSYNVDMITALFMAEMHFGLPVWWDHHRVSVNGCHVDYTKYDGNKSRSRIWASIMSISVYSDNV